MFFLLAIFKHFSRVHYEQILDAMGDAVDFCDFILLSVALTLSEINGREGKTCRVHFLVQFSTDEDKVLYDVKGSILLSLMW